MVRGFRRLRVPLPSSRVSLRGEILSLVQTRPSGRVRLDFNDIEDGFNVSIVFRREIQRFG